MSEVGNTKGEKSKIVGFLILALVGLLPALLVPAALDLPWWLDFGISIIWIITVTEIARRKFGYRI